MTPAYVAARLIDSRGRMQAHFAAHTRWSRWHSYAYHWDTFPRMREPAMMRSKFWGKVADLCTPEGM